MSPDPAVAAIRARQEVGLARRVKKHLWRSQFIKARIVRSGISRRALCDLDSLARIPPIEPGDLGTLQAGLTTTAALRRGTIRGTSSGTSSGGMLWSGNDPVVYSRRDQKRLALLGAQLLEAAGLIRGDVMIELTANCSTRDRLQLRDGARRLRVDVVSGPVDARRAEILGVGAVAGSVREATGFLEALNPVATGVVHTVVRIGDASRRQIKQLDNAAAAQGAQVVAMWAPPEAFAAWGQCRNGDEFHTWPQDEIVEVVDTLSGRPLPDASAGSLLVTWLGDKSTAFLRMKTAAVGELRSCDRCRNCGRASPRINKTETAPSFGDHLDSDPAIAGWSAELHEADEGDELVVFVAIREGSSALAVIESVERTTGGARVQVVTESEIGRRVTTNNGERFGDRRAFSDDHTSTQTAGTGESGQE